MRTLLALSIFVASVATGTAAAADNGAQKSAPRQSFDSLFGDEELARGKGVKVTSTQLQQAFIAYRANLAARGERFGENERTFREAQLLDRLIVTQILTNRAIAADRLAAEGMAEKSLAEAKKAAPNDDAFLRQVKAMSLTMEQFTRRIQEQALAEAVVQRELKSTLAVGDAEVQDFYRTGTDYLVKAMAADLEKLAAAPGSKPADIAVLRERMDTLRRRNLDRLEQPEKVRVAHIFMATRDRDTEEDLPAEQKQLKRQKLEKLHARAVGGEDFLKLVKEFSEDRGLAQTKGEYTFTRSDPFFPEFKAAAFSLAPGAISDIVTTPFGLHVLKLLEKMPAQKADFDKVSKDLKEFLEQQALQKAMPEFFSKLKKEAGVKILEARYRLELSETEAPR
jgi:parvulin-like peptidyl-prolyl isomerase